MTTGGPVGGEWGRGVNDECIRGGENVALQKLAIFFETKEDRDLKIAPLNSLSKNEFIFTRQWALLFDKFSPRLLDGGSNVRLQTLKPRIKDETVHSQVR